MTANFFIIATLVKSRRVQFLIIALFVWSCDWASSTPAESLPTDVILHTSLGDIHLHLYQDTPLHRKNFLDLSSEGFFDSLTFHRVLHKFVVQSGDPRSRYGTWTDSVMGPGYDLDGEFTEHHVHTRGSLAMARKPDKDNPDRRSSGSQFYIVTGVPATKGRLDTMEQKATAIRRGKLFLQYQQELAEGSFSGSFSTFQTDHPIVPFRYSPAQRECYLKVGGAPLLDFTYTVFGEVTSGIDTALRISRQSATPEGQLLNDIRIDSVSVLSS